MKSFTGLVSYHLVLISHSQLLQSVAMLPRFECSFLLRFSMLLGGLGVITFCYGRTFEKCKLARKLSTNGFTNPEIRTTLCYASLSDYNNQFLVIMDNETFYGLFAIHEPWCASNRHDSPESECNVFCNHFMDDHLRNDINCLRQIFDANGRWSTKFKQFYELNNLIDLKECEKTIVDDCSISNETHTNRTSQIEC